MYVYKIDRELAYCVAYFWLQNNVSKFANKIYCEILLKSVLGRTYLMIQT